LEVSHQAGSDNENYFKDSMVKLIPVTNEEYDVESEADEENKVDFGIPIENTFYKNDEENNLDMKNNNEMSLENKNDLQKKENMDYRSEDYGRDHLNSEETSPFHNSVNEDQSLENDMDGIEEEIFRQPTDAEYYDLDATDDFGIDSDDRSEAVKAFPEYFQKSENGVIEEPTYSRSEFESSHMALKSSNIVDNEAQVSSNMFYTVSSGRRIGVETISLTLSLIVYIKICLQYSLSLHM
jgi:hypothetical protein